MRGTHSSADLHVHSKYSDRPSEWFLRRLGAPECYVEPQTLYRRAREQGMDFVTITDHNRIEGALEIADLPGTFISSEVTTYFPEDGCKVHCLVWGIDEDQFRMIQQLRPNIYELQRYLQEQDILTAVSHPLFRVNDLLTVDHVERLLLLFKRFEAINGSRDPRAANLVAAIFANLTPELIDEMANRHDLAAVGDAPWEKWFTGGSDDHSGVYIGSAHTVTARADSVDQFLGHLRRGAHQPAGESGSSLLVAHSLCHIAYSYYQHRFLRDRQGTSSVIGELLGRLLGERPKPSSSKPARFLPGFAVEFIRRRRMRELGAGERMLVDELSNLFRQHQEHTDRPSSQRTETAFQTVSHLAHTLSFRFLENLQRQLREGQLLESLQTAASLGPILLGVAPYLTAFAAQHNDEPFLRSVAARFPAARHLVERSDRKAWVTDTFTDVNGVCRTIQSLGLAAKKAGRSLTVLTCLAETPSTPIELHNFAPVGRFRLPEYEIQELCFPPFLEMLEYIERQAFEELIISTPGPMGLVALTAGRLLNIRTTGVYHTDFPRVVRHMTDDHLMEQLTWRYMQWFYGQVDQVAVTSDTYRKHLGENGFDPARMWFLGHGVDLERFNPARRDPTFWERRGLKSRFTFLYVGRVSPDKNLELLLESFHELVRRVPGAGLAVVGDGPALARLRARHHGPRIAFTGFLRGDELAAAYASADVLVFPSQTDTFGNAVLEAHASGLPAIVSDWGGPPEIVRKHESGMIVDVNRPHALADAMHRLATDRALYTQLQERALRTAADHAWDRVLEEVWCRRTDDLPAANRRATHRTSQPAFTPLALDVA
jgi:glycosyltransferase involved in cell wall biosynthesis